MGSMAAYVKFFQFVEDLCRGVHQLHAAGHTTKVYLSNTAPDQTLDLIKTDLAEITNQNGYAAPVDVQNDFSEAAGTGTLSAVDVVVTASGGTVGPFRYVVHYNDTPTGPVDPLINYWDYGSAITLNDTETFTIDFGSNTIFTIT